MKHHQPTHVHAPAPRDTFMEPCRRAPLRRPSRSKGVAKRLPQCAHDAGPLVTVGTGVHCTAWSQERMCSSPCTTYQTTWDPTT